MEVIGESGCLFNHGLCAVNYACYLCSAVVHTERKNEKVATVLFDVGLNERVEVRKTLSCVPTANGGVDEVDSTASTCNVIFGSSLDKAVEVRYVNVVYCITEKVCDCFSKEHRIAVLTGIHACKPACVCAASDTVAVENEGYVFACDELLNYVFVGLNVGLLMEAFPVCCVLVSYTHLV